jgi:hypothetical protein
MENGFYLHKGAWLHMQYFVDWGMLTFQALPGQAEPVSTEEKVPIENVSEQSVTAPSETQHPQPELKRFEGLPEVLNPDLVLIGDNYFAKRKSLHIQF